MGNRETYQTNIQCLDCEARGKGTFTENENPVYTKGVLDRVVDDLDEGFSKNPDGVEGMSCDGCGSLNVQQV